MRRVPGFFIVLTALIGLSLPAAAGASTLQYSAGTLTFTGTGAFNNDVAFSGTGTVGVEVFDSDVITSAPAQCTEVSSPGTGTEFTCAGVTLVVANAGPG